MPAVWFRFRVELRERWRAWTALALLVGALAGTVFLLLAGSRRTGSAHDRFLRAQRGFDVGLAVSCEPDKIFEPNPAVSCISDVTRVPAVQDATTLSMLPAVIELPDGTSIQPDASDSCYSGPGQVLAVFDRSGRWGTTINRDRFVAGRAANPRAADEVVVSRETAHRLQLGVGSELRVRLLGGQDCLASPGSWRSPIRVRIVGVQLSPAQVRPPSGQYLQTLEVTPAFVRLAGETRDRQDFLMVRLVRGATTRDLAVQAGRAGAHIQVLLTSAEVDAAVGRAIRPDEVSLLILGALTALAGAVVLGQVIARQGAIEARHDHVLAALGMRRRARIALAALRGSAIGSFAAAVAVAVAVVGSAAMPIGLAREVEPAPGVHVDLLVVGLGALTIVLFVVVVTVVAAAVVAVRRERTVTGKPARLAGAAARAGCSPAVVSGARFALERGTGAAVVPVFTSFAGLTIAITAVVGALTFGAGLTHLRATPRLVGWNWDIAFAYPDTETPGAPSAEEARARVQTALATRDLDEVAMGTVWSPFPHGRDLQLGPRHTAVGGFIAFDGTARVGPSVISGRKPTAADEILLGPRTLAALGLRIGDTVDVIGQDGSWSAPGRETKVPMRVVGTGLAPMTTSLGRGAAITLAGLRRLNSEAREQAWYVRLGRNADRAQVVDAVRAAFPGRLRPEIAALESSDFADVGLSLDQIGSVPSLFAVIMAVMAAAVLAHVLTVGTRARRHDLAVLHALGFSRGQLARTVVWQATIYAAGAVLLGVPAGIALGRLIWRAYATGLGVVPEVVTPWPALAALAAAAIALAAAVGIVPGVRAARRNPASVLRAE